MDRKTAQSINNYNKIASNYDNTFDGKFTQGYKSELLKTIEVKSGYRVLDVACGNGTLLKMLSDKESIEAYGVDISDNMVKEAMKRYPQMQFRVTNSAILPFEDGYFDIVTVCAAFHHFTEPEKFLSEAKRVLAPEGHIYIADPYLPPIVRHVENLILPMLKMGDVKIYSKSELLSFLHNAGFINVSFKRFGSAGCIINGER